MPTAPQRGRPLQTLREASDVSEGVKRSFTPEDMARPENVAVRNTLTTRRRSYEQSGSKMDSPLRGVGDMAAHYEKMGWTDIEKTHARAAPSMYEFNELAEHGNNPFPLPTRWEDLSDDERTRAHAGLEQHGTSLGRMTADLGRGLDRAYTRSSQMGATPYAANFYEPESFARKSLERAIPGAPSEWQAAAIAMTSAKNKFAEPTLGGAMNTSNVNAAAVAGHIAQSGRYTTGEQFREISGEDLKEIGRTHGPGSGGIGMFTNVRKAGWGLKQGIEGADITDWMGLPSKTSPEGNPLFGAAPKTSPFAGSFVDEAAPFTVGDIHMAGIALPHLSGIKGSGQNINPSGADTGSKSERELAMARIPHAHAAMDFAFRQVLGERGLGKIRYQQGAAWGEEQIHRTLHPEPGARTLSYTPEKVYGWQAAAMPETTFTRRTKRGAGALYLPD
jgi:hypothetical protein